MLHEREKTPQADFFNLPACSPYFFIVFFVAFFPSISLSRQKAPRIFGGLAEDLIAQGLLLCASFRNPRSSQQLEV